MQSVRTASCAGLLFRCAPNQPLLQALCVLSNIEAVPLNKKGNEILTNNDIFPNREFSESRLIFNILWISILVTIIIWTDEIPWIRSDNNWNRSDDPIVYWVCLLTFLLGLLYNIIALLRRKIFGPVCLKCGNLLRNNKSKLCPNCGFICETNITQDSKRL